MKDAVIKLAHMRAIGASGDEDDARTTRFSRVTGAGRDSKRDSISAKSNTEMDLMKLKLLARIASSTNNLTNVGKRYRQEIHAAALDYYSLESCLIWVECVTAPSRPRVPFHSPLSTSRLSRSYGSIPQRNRNCQQQAIQSIAVYASIADASSSAAQRRKASTWPTRAGHRCRLMRSSRPPPVAWSAILAHIRRGCGRGRSSSAMAPSTARARCGLRPIASCGSLRVLSTIRRRSGFIRCYASLTGIALISAIALVPPVISLYSEMYACREAFEDADHNPFLHHVWSTLQNDRIGIFPAHMKLSDQDFRAWDVTDYALYERWRHVDSLVSATESLIGDVALRERLLEQGIHRRRRGLRRHQHRGDRAVPMRQIGGFYMDQKQREIHELHEMKGRRNAMNSSFMQQAQNLLSRGSSRHSERQSQADDRRDWTPTTTNTGTCRTGITSARATPMTARATSTRTTGGLTSPNIPRARAVIALVERGYSGAGRRTLQARPRHGAAAARGSPRARTESVFSGARSGARGSVLSGKRGSVVPARRQNRGSTNPALSANHLGASPDLPPPKRKGKSRENSPDGGCEWR